MAPCLAALAGIVQSRAMTNRRTILLAAAGAGAASGLQAGGTQPAAATPESLQFRAAVTGGDLKAVTAMLDRDPSLMYARDSQGVSAYLLACLNQRTEVAEELVKRGRPLDIFEAVAAGNDKRAAELAKDDPGVAHHRLPDGRTPLHLAVEAGKPAMVIFCAMRGADLSAGPQSPLLAAVDYPDATVAREMSVFLLMIPARVRAPWG